MVEKEFNATVRKNSGMIEAGKIVSKELKQFIGQRVTVNVKKAGKWAYVEKEE